MSKKTFIKGTFILTAAGVITRLLGFFFKIVLSRIIGSEGMGLYQLVMPVCAISYALAISGFEVAISRLTAKYIAGNRPDKAFSVLVISTIYSLAASIICCILVRQNASFIASTLFNNPDAAPLIKSIIISVPFSALHCMATSFFIGQQKTGFPGLSQLLEQLIRMVSVYFIIKITGKTDASIGVLSLIAGEIGAAIISVNYILFYVKKKEHLNRNLIMKYSSSIRKTALPVTINKLALYGLQSIETILLPVMLVKSGLTNSEALSTLGVITGMALPVILFPATLTNSVALLLLPSVAADQNNYNKLKKSGSGALMFSLIFGFICIIFMVTLGGYICEKAFNDSSVKDYVQVMAWLCPFIFVSTTFKSILNAMGKSSRIFANNMLSEAVSILFIIVLIPKTGISAYMYGLLTSQCLNAILQLTSFNRYVQKLRCDD